MVQIHRKIGWVLNPDDKKLNSILKMIERNDGKCPCHNTSEDTHCPCTSYLKENKCNCGLYCRICD